MAGPAAVGDGFGLVGAGEGYYGEYRHQCREQSGYGFTHVLLLIAEIRCRFRRSLIQMRETEAWLYGSCGFCGSAPASGRPRAGTPALCRSRRPYGGVIGWIAAPPSVRKENAYSAVSARDRARVSRWAGFRAAGHAPGDGRVVTGWRGWPAQAERLLRWECSGLGVCPVREQLERRRLVGAGHRCCGKVHPGQSGCGGRAIRSVPLSVVAMGFFGGACRSGGVRRACRPRVAV